MVDPGELLERDVPGLVVDRVEHIGEGWDHAAFLVNSTFVFRLPWYLLGDEGDDRGKGDAGEGTARAEVALLRAVAGRLPVSVPVPVFVPDHGRYFGYHYLHGPSVEDLLERGPWPWPWEAMADLVVDVVTAIERIVPVHDGRALGLRPAGAPVDPAASERALASPVLPSGAAAVVEAVTSELPGLWRDASARPLATLHADLGLDHWLLDADRRPYGLIDWSDGCVAPPELQLSTLMWHAPELAAAVARRYAGRTGRVVDGELIFACGWANATADLAELLDDGDAGEGDVDWCLEFLRRWSRPDLAGTLRGVTFTA